MIISLDLEATGLDIYHGAAKPFFVSSMNEAEEISSWEWDVDPLTREPEIPKADLIEVRDLIEGAEEIALQNGIYDGSVLLWYYKYRGVKLNWDWGKVRDTLYAAHLLASNEPHDLTTLGVRYLGINIGKYEGRLEETVKHARNLTRNKEFIETYGEWRIAKAGLPEMPSVKEKAWRADYWLPRAIGVASGVVEEHNFMTVLSEYGKIDASVTLPIYLRQREEIEQRDLVEIYETRLKLLPIVYKMESQGITVSKKRQEELIKEFSEKSRRSALICTNIAAGYDYELTLPKSGNNKSLLGFAEKIFGEDLPDGEKAAMDFGLGKSKSVLKRSVKSGQVSLNKESLAALKESLPPRSKGLKFVEELLGKRKADTGINYLEGYERFWLPYRGFAGDLENMAWRILFPRLNVTGTSTLRWSSSSPNEQNISKQEDFNLRYAFGPAPGREWWSLDAKNIELRIPAYESGERLLIDLFEKAEEPPYWGSEHILNFSVVYPEIWAAAVREVGLEKAGPYVKSKYKSSYYQWVKNGDFAVGYGAVDRPDGEGTADRAFHRAGSHALLKERFSSKEALNQKYINQAKRLGYVETLPDKTVNPNRGYPLLCTRTRWGDILPTVPLNYHVQGTAMWWMMKAMIRVSDFLEKINRSSGEDYRLIMQVHDELVFDFPASEIEMDEGGKEVLSNLPIVEEIAELMRKGGDDIGIPTPVSITYHPNNWKEEVEI